MDPKGNKQTPQAHGFKPLGRMLLQNACGPHNYTGKYRPNTNVPLKTLNPEVHARAR